MQITDTSAFFCLLSILYTTGNLAPGLTTASGLSKTNAANYTLAFYTCDVSGAGTEGTVNVTLTGVSGTSVTLQFDGKDKLDKQTTGIFSHGVRSVMEREVSDVGPICQVFMELMKIKETDAWKLGNVTVSYMDDLATFNVTNCPPKEDEGWYKVGKSFSRTDGACLCNISTNQSSLGENSYVAAGSTWFFPLLIAVPGSVVIILSVAFAICLVMSIKREKPVGQLSNVDMSNVETTSSDHLPQTLTFRPVNVLFQVSVSRATVLSALAGDPDYAFPVDSILLTETASQRRRQPLISWRDNSLYATPDSTAEADEDSDDNEWDAVQDKPDKLFP